MFEGTLFARIWAGTPLPKASRETPFGQVQGASDGFQAAPERVNRGRYGTGMSGPARRRLRLLPVSVELRSSYRPEARLRGGARGIPQAQTCRGAPSGRRRSHQQAARIRGAASVPPLLGLAPPRPSVRMLLGASGHLARSRLQAPLAQARPRPARSHARSARKRREPVVPACLPRGGARRLFLAPAGSEDAATGGGACAARRKSGALHT